MSNSNEKGWKTKYGRRRVRQELPSLDEAIVAAQGLTDDVEAQADIAASLMGLPIDEVRAVLVKMPAPRPQPVQSIVFTGPESAPRTVVVERKPSRRIAAGATLRTAVASRISASR